MAWRDSKGSRRKLLLFMSSMVVGVAALVAINSFGTNLGRAVDDQARELFGADMSLESSGPFSEETEAVIDSIGGDQARRVSLLSMVLFPESGASRLSMVRALEGEYPFYGSIVAEPPESVAAYRQGRRALVDRALLLSHGIAIGDSVQVGRHRYEVVGALVRTPRETAANMLISPPIYIALSQLDTALVSFGSRASYEVYFRLHPDVNAELLREELDEHLREFDVGMDTVEEERQEWSEALGAVNRFLGLAGFMALLLGGLGVGSAVHVYVKRRLRTVAVLRCLGASPQRTVWIYLAQAAMMGLLAGVAGCVAGTLMQTGLARVMADFLPFEFDSRPSLGALALGMGAGLSTALLFAMLPLMTVRRVAPLAAIRIAYERKRPSIDIYQWAACGVVAAGLTILAMVQAESIVVGAIYAMALGAAFGLLWLLAWALAKLARRLVPGAYVWRQGLANLHRPNNQTVLMIVALGLGTFLIMTMVLTESTLLASFARASGEDRPDVLLFDVQSDQVRGVQELIRTQELPVIESSPLVSMRIHAMGSVPVDTLRADSTFRLTWAHRREYRSTYRAALTDAENVVEGTFSGHHDGSGPVPVSIERELAEEELSVGVGDTIVFDVQGVLVSTIISSIREVDWQQTRANFFFVFPENVLEEAPQTHAVMTRTGTDVRLSEFQAAMVAAFPSVTAISLRLILDIFDEIYSRVRLVVRFMALFSIMAGILVLVGAIMTSRFQRAEESVLLKTLGASKRQVLAIVATEYLLLGVLATIAGLVLAVAASAALAAFAFELPYAIAPAPLAAVLVVVPGLTVGLGLFNSRGMYARQALEVMRSEV